MILYLIILLFHLIKKSYKENYIKFFSFFLILNLAKFKKMFYYDNFIILSANKMLEF